MVRPVLWNNRDGSVDINSKISTLQPSQKSHKTQWQKGTTDEFSVGKERRTSEEVVGTKKRWGGKLPSHGRIIGGGLREKGASLSKLSKLSFSFKPIK